MTIRQKEYINLFIILLIIFTLCSIVFGAYFFVKILNLYTEILITQYDQCKYCGEDKAGPFLCGNCNSITWYNFKNHSWILPTATFILSHRWAVLIAISGALILGPIYSLIDKKNELIKAEELIKIENEKSLKLVLDELSIVRSKIVNLEMLAVNENCYRYDMNEWKELHNSYTNIYWRIVPAFEKLLESTQINNKPFKDANENIKDIYRTAKKKFIENDNQRKKFIENEVKKSLKKCLVTYGPASIINHEKFEITCVTLFINYLNSIYDCEKDPIFTNINLRKKNAEKLFHGLRTSSILMISLIDSKWLLTKGKYPSQAADSMFYFNGMFKEHKGAIYDQIAKKDFNYKARGLNPFKQIKLIDLCCDY